MVFLSLGFPVLKFFWDQGVLSRGFLGLRFLNLGFPSLGYIFGSFCGSRISRTDRGGCFHIQIVGAKVLRQGLSPQGENISRKFQFQIKKI